MRNSRILIKKTVAVLILIMISIMSTNLMSVFAGAPNDNTKLVVQSNNNTNTIEISGNTLIYKIGGTQVGSVSIGIPGHTATPVMNNGKVEFQLPTYNGQQYQVSVEIIEEEGYQKQPSYFYQGSSHFFPGDGSLNLDITENNIHTLDFSFEEENQQGPGPEQPGPMMVQYPLVAYFDGITEGVSMNSDGSIVVPNNWTNGRVTFKAKICRVGGEVAPDDGENTPDANSREEIAVRIEGIANGSQINGSVTGTREYVDISESFRNYGKLTLHIVSVDEGGPINQALSVITTDLINIRAEAPLAMSFSLGSSAVDQAIITRDVAKDISIFFGNTETKLTASGVNVEKITGVNGANSRINADGTATVYLPDLSVETTTQVKVNIELKDGSTITRTVNIRRTAVMLEYDDRQQELRAGYVMNKGYLYNNQAHNDQIFDAYLQVMLYKDNVVVGYKQIKIDDEQIVNRLGNNEAWSIETFDENPIVLYDGSTEGINNGAIEGVNKASVFLTNGPVDFNSDLPSVEFGIGSGVTIEFGGEE
ncbi:MAG: hypothetical protein Q4G05_01345 [Clostridia bacterium]|nr:hypothetical protein [Clostridia bacterium]